MGAKLASTLNSLIDGMTTEDKPRDDIISAMASAADIDENTVRQILRSEIDCPPVERLRGFASALGTSLARLQADAESDGCEYDRSVADALGEEDPEAGRLYDLVVGALMKAEAAQIDLDL